MSNHTTRETQTGFPTYGLEAGKRPGLGFDTSENPQILDTAGNVAATFSPSLGTVLTAAVPVSQSADATGVFASIANPWGQAATITRAIFIITTQSAGASTLDIGVGANATTSNDGLLDGISGAAVATFDNLVAANAGTNGKTFQAWATTGFLNVAKASGNVSGLVGTLYIQAVRR